MQGAEEFLEFAQSKVDENTIARISKNFRTINLKDYSEIYNYLEISRKEVLRMRPWLRENF